MVQWRAPEPALNYLFDVLAAVLVPCNSVLLRLIESRMA